MEVQAAYLFFAIFDDEKSGEIVAKAISDQAKTLGVNVDGLAGVHRDTHGRVHIHEIGDVTGSQGAERGAIVGAAVGLIFPPSLLASAAVGAGIASLWAKLHDTGFQTDDLHHLGEELENGQSAVIFVGDETYVETFSDQLKDAKEVKKEPVPANLATEAAAAAPAADDSASDDAASS